MERDEDIIEIIADEPNEQASGAKNFITNFFASLPKGFVIVSCAICAAVILAAPIIGFSVPKSDKAIEKSLAALHERDKTYLAARDIYAASSIKKHSLDEELAEKQSELEKFHTSQDNLGKITEINVALEEERNTLQNEISEKQKTLDKLEASVSSYTNKIMTWTSGDYAVGTDIAPGSYMITGAGSIAIANEGRSTANKLLKSDGESFTLRQGDKIHIDGSAKIIPQ